MKITGVETIPVCVPLKKGMTALTAHGEHVVSAYVIVRLHTDEGLVGLGEATLGPRWSGETSRGCIAAIEEFLAPVLLGQDPRHITLLRTAMDRVIKWNPFAKAALEMALWDLAGKAVNLPVYQLLGGKVRNAVPIKMMIGAFDLDRVKAMADQFLQWGARCLKVKVGISPEEDIARVGAVRATAGPQIPIGIDANCGWNPTTALRALRRLRDFNILFNEQPIAPGNLGALAHIRQQIDIPLMADESAFTAPEAWQLTVHQCADILSVYPGKNGGIAATVEIAHLARAAGLVCALGSNLELGVGTAAMLHVAIAMPEIASEVYPADAIGPLYHEADLLTQPLALGPVVALVPEGPGLGVQLDEEQLRRWREG